MADTALTPALKPAQQYVIEILKAPAVLAIISLLAGVIGTLTAQYATAPKPMRIPAADSIPIPAPVIHVDTDPIVKAIQQGFAEMAAERAARSTPRNAKASLK